MEKKEKHPYCKDFRQMDLPELKKKIGSQYLATVKEGFFASAKVGGVVGGSIGASLGLLSVNQQFTPQAAALVTCGLVSIGVGTFIHHKTNLGKGLATEMGLLWDMQKEYWGRKSQA